MQKFDIAIFLLRKSIEEDRKKYEKACFRNGRKFEYYKSNMQRAQNELDLLLKIVEEMESGMLTVS